MHRDLKAYNAKRAPEYERIDELPEQEELAQRKRELPELLAAPATYDRAFVVPR